MVEHLVDPRRTRPQYTLSEREMLEAWLDFHRTTLLLKCEGLTDDKRKARPIATSQLSLHGLIRHMAEVERAWFQRVLAGAADAPHIWRDASQNDENELTSLDTARWEVDRDIWLAECEHARNAAATRSLDDSGTRRGEPVSLRWIFTHMIEEYARHNGHADLIRELIDGSVGD